ncbi:NADH dehydrogenase subunit 4L [Dimargaris cristalligena]|uniref:NADH-ubiquinone oxidoreductase chain 4L n=1 Tax=Dimargaris cristalligena TaxID=215637 RepID=A0A4Q0A2H8_9FUNG|nr:NADH dehydrogenase subunit 4L [Dimargaris cristalligena]|eukprot:RKP39552.1 NADH dehydrogenase subunit 4L [Dimargaris cristalligena]
MILGLTLYFIGIYGIILNNKNYLQILICIEILLLAVNIILLTFSLNNDDIIGQLFALYIICIAGAETAIGLAILVTYYRLRNSILIS